MPPPIVGRLLVVVGVLVFLGASTTVGAFMFIAGLLVVGLQRGSPVTRSGTHEAGGPDARPGAALTLTATSSVTPELTDDDYLPTSVEVPLPANAVMLPKGENVAVSGESNYQEAFDAVLGQRRTEGGRMGVEVRVTIVSEPSNPYDPTALAVRLGDAICGYIPRTAIPALAPVIAAVEAKGKIAACEAVITGGWDRGPTDRGHYGITLSLARPEKLLAAVNAP